MSVYRVFNVSFIYDVTEYRYNTIRLYSQIVFPFIT